MNSNFDSVVIVVAIIAIIVVTVMLTVSRNRQPQIPIIELSCPDSDSLQSQVWRLEDLHGEINYDRARIMNELIVAKSELYVRKFKIHGRDFDDLNEVTQ